MTANKNVDRILERARKAKVRLTPAAARVRPLAGKTGAAARRGVRKGVRKGRSWAAPQVKRAGEALRDNVAPKVSEMMTSAAERIDPDQHRRGRARKVAGAATVTAAASTATAFLRKRLRRTREADQPGPAGVQTPNGQASGQASTADRPAGNEDSQLRAS